ncbi:MAG: 50S ribosomal protein L35 [Candidatus Omnitrophota bacterium]
MPKLKTKKGVTKRFDITKSGNVKHRSANTGHLLSGRDHNRKRRLRNTARLGGKSDTAAIKRQMPYG